MNCAATGTCAGKLESQDNNKGRLPTKSTAVSKAMLIVNRMGLEISGLSSLNSAFAQAYEGFSFATEANK